jgi:hypothetical protein
MKNFTENFCQKESVLFSQFKTPIVLRTSAEKHKDEKRKNHQILQTRLPWYSSSLSLSSCCSFQTILFSFVFMSQDYLKSALPSQIMSERGSNLVVINPGMHKIQFCTLPIFHLILI